MYEMVLLLLCLFEGQINYYKMPRWVDLFLHSSTKTFQKLNSLTFLLLLNYAIPAVFVWLFINVLSLNMSTAPLFFDCFLRIAWTTLINISSEYHDETTFKETDEMQVELVGYVRVVKFVLSTKLTMIVATVCSFVRMIVGTLMIGYLAMKFFVDGDFSKHLFFDIYIIVALFVHVILSGLMLLLSLALLQHTFTMQRITTVVE